MKTIIIALALGISAVAAPSHAQMEFSQDGYVSVQFSEGVPDFSPLGHLNITESRHAEIEVDPAKTVALVWGKSEEGKDEFWLTMFDQTGGTVRSGPVKPSKDGTYSGAINLVDLDETIPGGVDIKVIPDHNTMLYRVTGINGSAIRVGGELPNFSVNLIDGDERDVTEYRGRILVINWWATSCSPCIAEMPGLNTLTGKYANDDRVAFLAVAWNSKREIEAFLMKQKFSYAQSVYTDESMAVLGQAFPRNTVVDAGGVVVFDDTGGHPRKYLELDNAIQLALRE